MELQRRIDLGAGAESQQEESLKAFLFGQFPESGEHLWSESEEEERLSRFEETLQSQLKATDSFGEAVEKVVTTAIVMEYGVMLAREAGFSQLVQSIAQAIMDDNQLRKQALLLINLYCKA